MSHDGHGLRSSQDVRLDGTRALSDFFSPVSAIAHPLSHPFLLSSLSRSLSASNLPSPSPLSPSPSSPSLMHIYLSYSNMPPIHMLPVELLTRIFQLGVDSDPLPDDRNPSQLTFEVSVSHVCRHWRHIALHTPHLWTVVHFRTKSHMQRGKVYLSRNARLPFDIYVDTCSEDTHKFRKDLLFRAEFLSVFDVVLPHIDRWRELHLKVADLDCKSSARKVLNTCGPAPLLRTLQLWHVQNWRTPERLFGAIGPPPVIVFAGRLPALKHIILQGVNLPWTSSPFLRNLSSIEYALHSDDVRMPWDLWRAMLDASPNLERLTLHYSGPRARSSGAFPPDGIDWWGADPPGPDDVLPPGTPIPPAAHPVLLPHLQEIQLHDLDSDYLIALFRTIEAPAVRSLHLELDTEDQDFTPFVDYLAAPPLRKRADGHFAPPHSPPPQAPSSSSINGPSTAHEHKREPEHEHEHEHEHGLHPPPKFPQLESLSVSALACSIDSWRALLRSSRRLTRLEVDFALVPEGAFDVLFEAAHAGVEGRAGDGVEGHVGGANGVNGVNGVYGANGVSGANGANGVSSKAKGKARATSASDDDDDQQQQQQGPQHAAPHTANANANSNSRPKSQNAHGEQKRESPILPLLTSVRLAGLTGKQLARLASDRRARGCRIRRWDVEEGARDEDGVALGREMAEISARWRAEEERRMRGVGGGVGVGGSSGLRGWEPWRLDEPLERLEWFREEVAEYDEEEEEVDDEEGEEEDGEGEEGEGEDGQDQEE